MPLTRSPSGVLLGEQRPRVSNLPQFDTTASGDDAVELALRAGLVLDPWQAYSLQLMCSELRNRWAAFEAAVIVARQNGKGGIIEGRELAALILFGETVMHSTHHFRTTREAFVRLTNIIDGSAFLRRKIKRVTTANGNEGIETKSGGRIAYVARSNGSGRGLSPDVNVIDEALIYAESKHTALMPSMSARPNPQIIYMSSPPDELDPSHDAVVLSRLRARALAGEDPRLLWLEWSVALEAYEAAERLRKTGEVNAVAADRGSWAAANPALGYRLSEDFVGVELASMSARGFAVERLGIGYWPDPDPDEVVVPPALDIKAYKASWVTTPRAPHSPVSLGLEVSPANVAALTVTAWRADGRLHGEVVQVGAGTAWCVDVAMRVIEKINPGAFFIDSTGPAGALVPQFRLRGIEPSTTSTADRYAADKGLVDDIEAGRLALVACPALDAAAEGATWRDVGDRKLLDRSNKAADVSPLVSLSISRHGLLELAAEPPPPPAPAPVPIRAASTTYASAADLMTAGF